jgi:hypothetical protein
MEKISVLFLLIILLLPAAGWAETRLSAPATAVITGQGGTAILSWQNPDEPLFFEVVLFRSAIPIAKYFSYLAVDSLCDKLYAGQAETYADTGLAENLPYYYILFARDRSGNVSDAVILEKKPTTSDKTDLRETNTLANATSEIVNRISRDEAEIIYNYNGKADKETDDDSRRLSLFIIAKSTGGLSNKDKNAISYFIRAGTPTTILLGTGERAGVLNSYLSAFDKLPRNVLEWQDIIKIANGRWPDKRNVEAENRAADIYFSTIYERKPDADNPNDNAAITVIAYGLRPAARNMASEKKAIEIYRSIFGKNPVEAVDWDLVRAIAYSGAIR